MHDRPTAAELVEAVREFLENDVLDSVEGRVRFHARVAVNVLGIVERELREDPAHEEDHRRRLAGLLGHDGELFDLEAELASAIREGRMDDRADVFEIVSREVARKLAVSHPGYA